MNVLAIDTALPAVSVCVLDGNSATPIATQSVPMDRGHAEALVPLVEKVVSAVPGGFESIGRVAVSVGPGSFTGIRVGIAAAKGISLVRGIPIVGVSTLAAFAAPFVAGQGGNIIAVAIDARHSQVYIQAFAPGGRVTIPARAMPVRDAIRALGSGPVRLVGPASTILAIEAWSMGLRAEVAADTSVPDIVYIARLGLLADPKKASATPMYLRPVDAKISTPIPANA